MSCSFVYNIYPPSLFIVIQTQQMYTCKNSSSPSEFPKDISYILCLLKDPYFRFFRFVGCFFLSRNNLSSFATRETSGIEVNPTVVCAYVKRHDNSFHPRKHIFVVLVQGEVVISTECLFSQLVSFFKGHQILFNVQFFVSGSCCCFKDQDEEEKHGSHHTQHWWLVFSTYIYTEKYQIIFHNFDILGLYTATDKNSWKLFTLIHFKTNQYKSSPSFQNYFLGHP